MTTQQYERLQLANKTKKYGHLETWQELYHFQRSIATPTQLQEIAAFAKRKNNGEKIVVPLMDMLIDR